MNYSPEDEDDTPFVSVVVPARNEASTIEKCLISIAEGDYPKDKLEILVVDGISRDDTRRIVNELSDRYNFLRLLDNPVQITSTALNIGIKGAKGDIIMRVDAHSYIEADYISKSVEYLKKTEAWCVGGPMRARGDSYIGSAIALATSSPFGVGNSYFHYSEEERYVDTVYLGVYPRFVFERIGLFDENLARNQDDEFNYRLREQGGTIFMTPKIRSHYDVRPSLGRLFKQYFQYGLWKIEVFVRHPRSIKARHLIPSLFVLSLIIGFFLSFISNPIRYLFLSELATYLAFSLLFALPLCAKEGRRYLPILPLVFFTLHFAYGSGFLIGLLKRAIKRKG